MSNEVKEYLEPGKKNIILIYILFLSGVIAPIVLPFIGAVFAFAYKDHENSLWRSHYIFAFRTFCFGAFGVFIAMITAFTIIFIPLAFIFYILAFVWFVVRSIIAIHYLLEGLPHPNPLTFWIK